MSDKPPASDATPHASSGSRHVDHDLIAQADPYRDGMSTQELLATAHKSRAPVPWWLVIMVVVVLVMAVALNAPFLSRGGLSPVAALSDLAPGKAPFLDGGMIAALIYVGGGFLVIFWFTCRRGGGD